MLSVLSGMESKEEKRRAGPRWGDEDDVLSGAFATCVLAAVRLHAATVPVSVVVTPYFGFKHKLGP